MMTDQETKEIKETLAKMGITKWTKWKIRLENGANKVVGAMILLCIFTGIAAMGWKIFWATLLVVILLEIIITLIKNALYTIKKLIKKRK